jgi:transketolase
MRGSFIRTLVEIADSDPRAVFLTGDLGFLAVEPFAARFPDRFINVGVAEQNMIALATGLAEAGFVPLVYSIVPFAVLRAYEFIRNGPIYHRLPVRIVGVGGGFEYGHDGISHYGLEDVGVLRVQPGITVVAPADHEQARTALLATWNLAGPVYYRLGKDETTIVPGLNGQFALGRAQSIGDGKDVLIITLGSIASEGVRALEYLAERGVSGTLMIVASVSPPPVEDLVDRLRGFPVVFTVEAHYIVGGLGSLVAEVMSERALRCRLFRVAVECLPDGITGSRNYLYSVHGLTGKRIAGTVLKALDIQPGTAS